MFINLNVYFRRIIEALENVVAPEIESDHVRGQVFAIVDLIRQITDRVEYKPALIAKDIELGMDSIKRLTRQLCLSNNCVGPFRTVVW